MILLDEDFNDGFPSEWSIDNDGNTDDTWKCITERGGESLDGTPFMIVDSDDAGSGVDLEEEMITPKLINIPELSPEQSLILSFTHYFNYSYYDEAKIMIFNGSNWITLKTYSSDQGSSLSSPTEETFDITDYINDELQISFLYYDEGTWAWYWAVDNVKIEIVDSEI